MSSIQELPNEMLCEIFQNLEDYNDKYSAYQTCGRWSGILGDKPTAWMFQGALPSLAKYLSKKDILNCRTACKKWKTGVDSYLESGQPFITAAGDSKTLDIYNRPRCLQLNFNASALRRNQTVLDTIGSFIIEFDAHQVGIRGAANPIVSRSVEMNVHAPRVPVKEFFKKFGAHLLSLKLSIVQTSPRDIVAPLTMAEFIFEILEYVPNLKKLILVIEQDLEATRKAFHIVRDRRMNSYQARHFLNWNSAPPLHQLQNLDLNVDIACLHDALQEAYAPGLTKFVLHDDILPDNLTNLKELVWNYRTGFRFSRSQLTSFTCRSLQRLSIIFGELSDHAIYPANALFNQVEEFKHSLKYLSIHWRTCAPIFPSELELPHVEELCFEIGPCNDVSAINLTFLASMPSVRKLKFILRGHTFSRLMQQHGNRKRKRSQKPVDRWLERHVRENIRLPFHANVWRLAPTLQTVEIQIVDHQRWPQFKKVRIYSRQECLEELAG